MIGDFCDINRHPTEIRSASLGVEHFALKNQLHNFPLRAKLLRCTVTKCNEVSPLLNLNCELSATIANSVPSVSIYSVVYIYILYTIYTICTICTT